MVSLASSNSAVTVPSTVTVPAGATSAGFTATASSVSTAQTVTLTATASGVSEIFNLQLGAACAHAERQRDQCRLRQRAGEHGGGAAVRDFNFHRYCAGNDQRGNADWHRIYGVGNRLPDDVESGPGGDAECGVRSHVRGYRDRSTDHRQQLLHRQFGSDQSQRLRNSGAGGVERAILQ